MKKVLKEIMQFQLHSHSLEHKNPDPGGHEIHDFRILLLRHHYNALSLFEFCPRIEKK